MQPQYSQGAAPSHHPPPYAPPEVSQASGGSITSSLRQWRKKDYLEKQQSTDQPQTSVAENPSHVARVAPHTYYPRLTNDVCHYQHQYSEYGVPYKPPAPTPVKYSEIVDNPQAQTIEHITPVIPKLKDKEFGDLCSVPPQPHLKQYQDQMTMKQSYPDGTKQTYSDPTVHHQYISKESQIHPFLQKQSQMHQYIQKEPYQQFLPKYGMQGQYSQSYPSEPNNFLAHLNKINPRMAQSIINDTHLRDPQISMYHSLEQNRSYPQPQRMYHAPSMHSSPTHAHRNIPQSYNYAQPYNYNVKSSMQPNDPYNRVHQYQHNVPKYLPEYKMNAPMEQPIPNISPQRMFNESVHMNYAPMPPKISPNYPHCSQLEYAQHYQHRRAHLAQEFYSHAAYKSGYVQNPQISPEGGVSDSRTRKSSLKQYLETWVEEDISGNLPDLVVSSNNLSDVENMENLKGTMCIKGSGTQEQPLYVLDTTEIPNENLPHFLHLQQFEKLPDNIRGYYQPTNVMPPGSRRIIIENNNADGLPENSQVIRGNSAPIVPKISDTFTENGNMVAIVSQSENQRKMLASEETPTNMGRGLENQIQNLENKVVQIHIIEDSEATTNNTNLSSDITETLTTHQQTTSGQSDTVIIQSNVFQHNPSHSDSFTKIIDSNESSVVKKHISEVEEENRSSTQSEAKISSEDGIKSMPVIDESVVESIENEIVEEIFVPSKDAASAQENHTEGEMPEDLQSCENGSSRRSSICSIYKEMEHIHGENTIRASTNSFESNNTVKSSSPIAESVGNNLDDATPTILEDVEVNSKNVCGNSDSGNTNDLQENSEERGSCVKNIVQNKVEELNTKEKHSELESSKNCDSDTDNCQTDLTSFTNLEMSLSVSKGKIELSDIESTKTLSDNDLQETVLENENHRQISKKLRTAKVTTTNIPEDCASEDTHTIVEELISTDELIQTEFFDGSLKNLEGENDAVDILPLQVKEDVIPLIKENLLLDTKIKSDTTIDPVTSQSGNDSLMPAKEVCFDETQNEPELSESLKKEGSMTDGLKSLQDIMPLPNVSDGNEKGAPLTNTSLETMCHQIDDFVCPKKDEKTIDGPDIESIDDSQKSENTKLQDIENVEHTDSTQFIEKTKIADTVNIQKIENCEEESIKKDTTENIIFSPKPDDVETFSDELKPSFSNYVQTTKPLNLSLEKKCVDNKFLPRIENYDETSTILDNQIETTSISDSIGESLNVQFIPEILKLENSLLTETPKKFDKLVIRSDAKRNTKQMKSKPRKKETIRINDILLKKQKMCAVAATVTATLGSEENSSSLSENTVEQVDVAQATNTSSSSSEFNSMKQKITKCVTFELPEDTLKLHPSDEKENASDEKENTTLTELKYSSVQEDVSKSVNVIESYSNDEKSKMPELIAISDPKSNTAEITETEVPKTPSSLATINTEHPVNWSEVDDFNSKATEIPEVTMPILKCMVNRDEKLNSSDISVSADVINCENAKSTSVNRTASIKIKRKSIPKFENSYGLSEKKKQLRTSKKSKYKERLSDMRRKSRRLIQNSVTITSEYKPEQYPVMPNLVKESNTAEVVEENLRIIFKTDENIVETESDNKKIENTHPVVIETGLQPADLEEEIIQFSEKEQNVAMAVCTENILESNLLEEKATEVTNSYDQSLKVVESPILEEPANIVETVTEKENNSAIEEKESEKDISEESVITNQEENFENNDTSIVYQINDTNVVLQIADELLEINVITQNGRKIISVKTFSDAIIMNTSEESNCPTTEDTCPMEKSEDANIEIQDQPLGEDATPLNNNYIDNTSDLKYTNTNIDEEANFCFKEMCTATDLTTVGDDVFIYNEEVVSSSTEIATKEEQTVTITDDISLERKYNTRKSSKREKKVSWKDEDPILDKVKCLTRDSETKPPKDDTVEVKVNPNISENSFNKKSTTIKDSLRKSPKTKAALKFVETVKTSKPKVKESKVPSKTIDTIVETDNHVTSDKIVTKIKKPPLEENAIKEESNSNSNIKNIPKQKYRSQSISNKNESHNNDNKNKGEEFQIKTEVKSDEAPKLKEKPVKKDLEKGKEINTQVKSKRSLSPKEDKSHHNKSLKLVQQTPKKKPKNDKVGEEPLKTTISKIQSENKKNLKQKEEMSKTIKKDSELEKPKAHKEIHIKKNRSKSLEEQPKIRFKQKTEDKIIPAVTSEEPISEEKQISVQENSITSSTCQEAEASIKQRSSKLIQQITDDWDDDSDDLKSIENSCKRRLSLQEYNSRKRTNSTAEQETTQPVDLNKTDLTDNLFSSANILIGNKCKREISPDSPILSVKFNNKTYSRSSSLFTTLKPNAISNNSDHEHDLIPKEVNTVLDYKKEEPLSSAIELHLPKINRMPRPAYNQEYLRNALMHDLQAVNAYTTSLIKENQQLMQRFLEQKRLTAEELKKVKTIIRYKRLVQHLSTIRINEMQTPSMRDGHTVRTDADNILYPSIHSLNSAAHLKFTTDNYDINRRQSNNVNQILNASEKSSKINHLHHPEEHVKVNLEKRKKKRFRFLYSDEETEPHNSAALNGSTTALTISDSLKRPRLDNSVPALDPKVMDYSVHQSNSQGQLTLVFKRSFKSDPKMQPFVRLERLPSIDLLAKNRLH